MKFLIVSAISGLLFLGACGKPIANQPTNPLKSGWTIQKVTDEKTLCKQRLVGDAKAEVYCNCLVDDSSVQISYDGYKTPMRGNAEFTTLENIDAACAKK